MQNTISHNLSLLRGSIEAAARDAGRDPSEITLIGVSKTRSVEEVVASARAGLNDLGENRVQEAIVKIPAVRSLLDQAGNYRSNVRWHLIGHLQSNKVNKAVEMFDVIHSIDSVELARRVGESSSRQGKIIDCYVQVNASGEAAKSGTNFEEAEVVVGEIVSQESLRFLGFMTIGPATNDLSATEQCFRAMAALRDRLSKQYPTRGKAGLSMGMSGDYELAIACGSTAVRIGTALFGER